jgi:quinol monooxygenase YgiN
VAEPLVYVDTSDIREGALDELKEAIPRLVEFIDENEPQLLAYNVYLSEDSRRMTVVHVHPDSASLERHLEVGGPIFRQYAHLITLTSIRVYGEPSEEALRQLREKARMLGSGDVLVERREAGFSRL